MGRFAVGLQLEEFNSKEYEKWIYDTVWSVMSKFGRNPRWDFDELVSEAWLAFTESRKSFNPEYSTSLTAYARPYIYKRLLEFINVNMYTFKVRYYNIKDDKAKLEALNRIENGILTETSGSLPTTVDGTIVPPYELAQSGVSLDEEVCRNEQIEIVRDILQNQLTAKQRRAIKMRFDDELSYRQIGQALGCSSESARNLVNKSIEKIKFRVKDAGINNTDD